MTRYEDRNLTEHEIRFARFAVFAAFGSQDVWKCQIEPSGDSLITIRNADSAFVQRKLESWESVTELDVTESNAMVTVRCKVRPLADSEVS